MNRCAGWNMDKYGEKELKKFYLPSSEEKTLSDFMDVGEEGNYNFIEYGDEDVILNETREGPDKNVITIGGIVRSEIYEENGDRVIDVEPLAPFEKEEVEELLEEKGYEGTFNFF